MANREDKWAEKLANPFVKDDNGTITHKAALKGAYKGTGDKQTSAVRFAG